MGAPVNNKNSSIDKRLFSNAIRREAVQNPELMLSIVKVLYAKALEGDLPSIKEILDRTDGKAIQQTEISGLDGGEILTRIERVIIDKKS